MKTEHYKRVEQFMVNAEQVVPEKPCIPPEEIRRLRANLIFEEAMETINALGYDLKLDSDHRILGIEKDEDLECNIEEVADGCADISVVTIGTLIAFGIKDRPILEEVDGANLRKFEEGCYKREDGKHMKPPGWTPPKIMKKLEEQGYQT
jgi:predicted HAD superfamily Cof-like phosphohydrolase